MGTTFLSSLFLLCRNALRAIPKRLRQSDERLQNRTWTPLLSYSRFLDEFQVEQLRPHWVIDLILDRGLQVYVIELRLPFHRSPKIVGRVYAASTSLVADSGPVNIELRTRTSDASPD